MGVILPRPISPRSKTLLCPTLRVTIFFYLGTKPYEFMGFGAIEPLSKIEDLALPHGAGIEVQARTKCSTPTGARPRHVARPPPL